MYCLVVRMVIVGGLVADAVLVLVGMGVADDVPRRAEAHEAGSEVGMWGHGMVLIGRRAWPVTFLVEASGGSEMGAGCCVCVLCPLQCAARWRAAL